MRLHLVRHLAPTVAPGICYGGTDLAVARTVHEQMLPQLLAHLPAGAPLYSSPLRRCTQLAGALGGAVHFDTRLAELNFGSWEMREWEQIPRAEVDAWAEDVVMYRPGGADSVYEMALRVDAFYAELMLQAHAECIVVCHAGTMRLLAARQRGLAPLEMAHEAGERPHAIGYGEIIILDCV
jgi:alpha-ribazole phosphatase